MIIAGLSIQGPRVQAAIIKKRPGLPPKPLAEETLELPADMEERIPVLRSAIETWQKDHGVNGIAVGLDLSLFSHHIITTPVTAKADIPSALSFELEKHLPLPPEEYIFDFHMLNKPSKGDDARLLVLAVRKDRIAWIIQAIADLGITLIAIRCIELEVLNEFMSTESLRNVIFLTMGGGTLFAFALAEDGTISIKSLPPGSDIAGELSALTDTYNRGVYSSGITNNSMLQGVSPRELAFSAPSLIAHSTAKRRAVRMNFLPDHAMPRMSDYYNYSLAALAAAAVILFFLTSLVAYYKDYSTLKNINSRINEIKSTSSQLVETKRETEELSAKLRFLNSFHIQRNRQIEIFKQVSLTLPRDAWLTFYSAAGKGSIELEGFARRSATIIAPFENHEMFRNVEFTSSVTVKDGQERFSISMEVAQ